MGYPYALCASNFKSPVHASAKGLHIPIVYNCSGYESLDTLALLDGIVDIYFPDIKYADDRRAAAFSSAVDYATHNRNALKEMWRQVGPLIADVHGIAILGMIVRHLVLPENCADSKESLPCLAQTFGKEIAVSLKTSWPLEPENPFTAALKFSPTFRH